jgi:FtsZ-binding cell division protein ZapB
LDAAEGRCAALPQTLRRGYNPRRMKKNRTDDQQTTLAGTEEAEILGRLGLRVEKAVTTIQDLRKERDQLRARVTELESRVQAQGEASTKLETLEEEHDRFRKERSEIRNRIENILGSLEGLDAE